jgi:hypothetical protein
VRAFEAIRGVPELVVPDNAKTAIVKASFYEPEVNRTYAEMAAHYGTAVLPARPRKPRDKAKVEQAVLIVERWLLGRLRRRTFYGLAGWNQTPAWRAYLSPFSASIAVPPVPCVAPRLPRMRISWKRSAISDGNRRSNFSRRSRSA